MNTETPTFTPSELAHHLDKMKADAVLLPIDQLLDKHPVACIDGRNASCVIGAPGGNAGLFLQLLAAYEKHQEKPLTSEKVRTIFNAYLYRFGRFYMHTDTHALENLRVALNPYRYMKRAAESVESLLAFIKAPPKHMRQVLLRYLVMAEHIGCGHIRLMIEHPEEYGIRPRLIKLFLAHFFETLWLEDERLIYESLPGGHKEQAVVNIYVDAPPACESMPLVLACPHYNDLEVFVNHSEAIAYIQTEQALFLARCGLIKMNEVGSFVDLQKEIGLLQLKATLHHLAAELRRYDVVFDGSLDIKKIEEIGDQAFNQTPFKSKP